MRQKPAGRPSSSEHITKDIKRNTRKQYGADEGDVEQLVRKGSDSVEDGRLRTILEFCPKVNLDPKAITDEDVESLRSCGLSDKVIVQVVHLMSDFGSYNRLNLSLDTDYDYRNMWRSLATE